MFRYSMLMVLSLMALMAITHERELSRDHGDLHVTGNSSNNITVFSSEGKFVRSYEVKSPKEIAIDRAGFSLVSSDGSLSIFNPFGKLIKEIKGIGNAMAVAISADGSVWVSIKSSPDCLLKY